MNQERPFDIADLDVRTREAIQELRETISARYLTTTFEFARAADDPTSIHLLAVADVDDPDEVGDLVVDRVVAFQVDEGIPLHVIPLRTPERVQAALEVDRGGAQWRAERLVRLLGETA
jgi:hypothetical protein